MKTEPIYPHLTTRDSDWKDNARKLAKRGDAFTVHDLNVKGDTTFVLELARQHPAFAFKIENGRAEFCLKKAA